MRKRIGEIGLLSDDHRREVVFKKTCKYKALNKQEKRVICYQIDGGLISRGKRCDYGLGVPDDNKFILIELKGRHMNYAAKQMMNTISDLKTNISQYAISGRIVLSKTPRPDLRSTHIVALERKLSAMGGDLIRRTRIFEEEI